jgi:hypothetical protein
VPVSALTYDISYGETRSRLTNAFRILLAIPHLIVVTVWGYLAEILAFIQWFIIVFTGKRNKALWDLQWAWLGYAGRVQGYTNLMFDPYPAFGTAAGPVPVSIELGCDEPADRLTNGLRFIWAIPAILIAIVVSIAFTVVVIISWFAIVITGKHPRGLFDFSLRALRFMLRVNSYLLLMTDTYPKWESGDPARSGAPDYVTPPPASPSTGGPLTPPTPEPPASPPTGGPLPPPGA